MKILKEIWKIVVDIFEEEEEVEYDPVHIGGMIILTIFFMAIIYWDLWALIVYKGGIFKKIIPFFSIIFTSKTLKDYGYSFFWDAGVFDGWLTNLIALIFLLFFIFIIIKIFKKTEGRLIPDEKE
ncbi:MAG: hypothetical protein DRI36_04195 [Caldiserica bacterium]|nr:MAG: hypothetical protein DRI36_04195 [Caldisericota bacterium]